VLDGLAGLAGFAFAGDDDGAHAELVQCVVDALLAVTAVGGDGAGPPAGAADDPLDGRRELRRVGRVALVQGVVEHDAVVVVDDLRLVAELDRLPEPALGDRPGVAVVQADPPGRPIRCGAGQSLPGLRGDPPGDLQQLGQVVDRAPQPAPAAAGGGVAAADPGECLGLRLRPAQRPAGVGEQPFGVRGGAVGQHGELTGDPTHGGLRLVPALRAAQP